MTQDNNGKYISYCLLSINSGKEIELFYAFCITESVRKQE